MTTGAISPSHPDTRLNRFFEASAEVGHLIAANASSRLDISAGFKYTNVKWSSWGGSYTYSSGGYRNTSGTISSTLKGLTFEQRLPVVFAGLNSETVTGNWTTSIRLRGGFTVGARDIDDHWLRNLRFYDHYKVAPVLAGEASAEYHINHRVSAFASASYEKIFRAKGDIYQVDTTTGVTTKYSGAAGGDYETLGVSVGLRGKF